MLYFPLALLQDPRSISISIMIVPKRELINDDDDKDNDAVNDDDADDHQTPKGRRGIRSRYLSVKNMIHGNFILRALDFPYSPLPSTSLINYSWILIELRTHKTTVNAVSLSIFFLRNEIVAFSICLHVCSLWFLADEREEIARADSHKFNLIFNEMETLHQLGIYFFI